MLQMRDVIDPKRHFKKQARGTAPSAVVGVGTVVEGPTEFFSARIPRKQRQKTLVEEVLAAEDMRKKSKARFAAIQQKRTSGKRAHYNRKQAHRKRDMI